MRKKKINYSIGDLIWLPLKNKKFAKAVVVRSNYSGCIYGRFFGPAYDAIECINLNEPLKPDNSILDCIFGDFGLVKGEWGVIGSLPGFNREVWRFPEFFVKDTDNAKKFMLTSYDESNLSFLNETLVLESEPRIENAPKDGVAGSRVVEIWISRLLNCE